MGRIARRRSEDRSSLRTESLYERGAVHEEVARPSPETSALLPAAALAHQGQPVGASDADELVLEWLHDIGQGVAGSVTPKIAIGAIVGNEDGEISSFSGPTRASGSTRPDGPTWDTRPPRSP